MGKDYYVHPTAVVDEPVDIDEGTKIWHFAHIMAGVKIGRTASSDRTFLSDQGLFWGII